MEETQSFIPILVSTVVGGAISFFSTRVVQSDAWLAYKTYAAEKDISIYQFKSDIRIRTKGL